MWLGRRAVRAPDTAAARLIADAETFLSGDYEEHLLQCGDYVPKWARLNSCAHSGLETLRAARDSTPPESDGRADAWETTWRKARQVFAAELLERVQDDEAVLVHLQRHSIIPLELEMIKAEEEGALSPFDLVRSFRAALRSTAP